MEEECFHMNMKDFGFYKGVDLGGWFSQCDYSEDRMDHFITEKDFQVIAGWGLDHVRIPVDYNVMETENGGWTRSKNNHERHERTRKQASPNEGFKSAERAERAEIESSHGRFS